MSKRPKLFAFVKDTHTGQVRRIEMKPSTNTSKLERHMVRDLESGLWLYKKKYEYKDRQNGGKLK